MAGPEGFDPSLIEAEALLKKMKPRPANISAARIVYEAGRAVGKEEMQSQWGMGSVSNGGMSAGAAPLLASKWKGWILPAWAGGATALCILLAFQVTSRKSTNDDFVTHPTSHSPHVAPNYPQPSQGLGASPGYGNQGLVAAPPDRLVEQQPPVAPQEPQDRVVISQPNSKKNPSSVTASDSRNRSGSVRDGRELEPSKPREKTIAEYLREQLPPLESRRNIDPLEIRDGVLQPPQAGMTLTTMGMIKTP
jgi:hypothetical protein